MGADVAALWLALVLGVAALIVGLLAVVPSLEEYRTKLYIATAVCVLLGLVFAVAGTIGKSSSSSVDAAPVPPVTATPTPNPDPTSSTPAPTATSEPTRPPSPPAAVAPKGQSINLFTVDIDTAGQIGPDTWSTGGLKSTSVKWHYTVQGPDSDIEEWTISAKFVDVRTNKILTTTKDSCPARMASGVFYMNLPVGMYRVDASVYEPNNGATATTTRRFSVVN